MVPAKFFYDPDTLQQDTIGITTGSYPDLNKHIFKKKVTRLRIREAQSLTDLFSCTVRISALSYTDRPVSISGYIKGIFSNGQSFSFFP